MAGGVKDLLFSCVSGWLFFYGALLLVVDLLPLSICVGTIAPLMLFTAAWWMRIPAPDADVVKEILGPDPIHGKCENGSYMMSSIAHRGAPLDAPENSLTAFRLCAEKGCSAVELDVCLSKDEVAVVFHDSTTDRLTGEQRRVADCTWEELSKMDISATHHLHSRFQHTPIARFDTALELCLDLDLRIFIDCKDNDLRLVKVILDAYGKFPKLYKRAVVSGFNPLLIYMIRRANPGITCSLAFRPFWFSADTYSAECGPTARPVSLPLRPLRVLRTLADKCNLWMLYNFTYYFLGLSAILLHNDIVSPEDMRLWRERGLRVVAWSVNLPLEKKYFSKVLKVTYMTDTMIGEPGSD